MGKDINKSFDNSTLETSIKWLDSHNMIITQGAKKYRGAQGCFMDNNSMNFSPLDLIGLLKSISVQLESIS